MRAGTVLTLTAALAAAFALAGCSTESATASATAKGKGRQCFASHDVSSFAFVNDSTVNIRVGVSDYYRLDLLIPCTGGTFAEGVALKTTGATDFICDAVDAELIVPNVGGPNRCPVSSLHKLTPEEVAALTPKTKP